ncbi:MAG: hypothetical protein CXR30_02795 [Geobacter sp.]|nr:MAG: hypothetical protein CXR30_02795 [Geobacter sp.]
MKTFGIEKLLLFCALIMSVGCTMKMGSIGDKSHFTYPNSNVEPLGHVSASVEKFGLIIPKDMTKEDVRALFEKALSQKAGADVLINYKIDTEYTVIPIPIFSLNYTKLYLSGTAAKMTVGQKELKELKSAY